MAIQDDTEEPLELVLTLTRQTVDLLGELTGPEALHPDHTPQSLAVVWLARWGRRANKQLDYHERFGPGTETMTVAVDRELWRTLRDYGTERRWWPDEAASAVLNDCGGKLTPRSTYETLD